MIFPNFRVQVVNGKALAKVRDQFRGLASGPDPAEWKMIGDAFRQIMVEDNRVGVLAGKDKNGRVAPRLKYRSNLSSAVKPRAFGAGRGAKMKRFKGGTPDGYGKGLGRFKRTVTRGPRLHGNKIMQLPNNNLSTYAYKGLAGPRLAPRGDASRTISNYSTRYYVAAKSGTQHSLRVIGAWKDVLTPDGQKLLPMHFLGKGRNPTYDLTGVRSWGMAQCRQAAIAWFRSMVHKRLSIATPTSYDY